MKTSLVRIRHARSKKDFPFLPLEEGEYVELLITRSKTGLILLWVVALLVLVALGFASTSLLSVLSRSAALKPGMMSSFWIFFAVLSVALLGFTLLLSKVYLENKMFITNRRIFHFSAESIFSKSQNIISLSKIEDISLKKKGLVDYIFSLGTLRLSTVGDETTYTFPYVDTPQDELDLIAHLIDAAKK